MKLEFKDPNYDLPEFVEYNESSKEWETERVLIAFLEKGETCYGIGYAVKEKSTLNKERVTWRSNEDWLDECISGNGDIYKFAWAYIPEQNIDWSKITSEYPHISEIKIKGQPITEEMIKRISCNCECDCVCEHDLHEVCEDCGNQFLHEKNRNINKDIHYHNGLCVLCLEYKKVAHNIEFDQFIYATYEL